MAAETSVTDNPYGIEALWNTSDYVGKGVFVILIVMSLWSWLVMINKWLDQRSLRKLATEAEKNFWTANSIQEGVTKLKSKANPFRDIANDGLMAVEHHRKSTARDVTSNIELADWVQSHIDRRTTMLQSSLQSGMVVLASVGATSPFVGLFGTVWGIYIALISISIAGQASLDKVAGPIGEALIMTALGLAVAIPAVLGYNVFGRLIGRIEADLEGFARDLRELLCAPTPAAKAAALSPEAALAPWGGPAALNPRAEA
jgi:biopolymer transport protein ExbB